MIHLIFKKDLKLFFSNKKSVVLTFLIPIILISLFAFAFGGTQKSNTTKQIEVLYEDNDLSTISKSIVNELNQVKELKLTLQNNLEAENLLKKGKKVAFLRINKGVQDSLNLGTPLPIELKYDSSKPFEYGILTSIITGKLMSILGPEIQKKKTMEFLNNSFGQLSQSQKNKIIEDVLKSNNSNSSDNLIGLKTVPIIKKESKKGNLGLIQAVAGTAIMMLLFSISGVGGGLLEEKESGTLFRLMYAPIKPTDILIGKMGATFIISLLQLVVMFIFAWLAFDLPIFTDVPSLIVLTICVAFAVASFGMFLVAIAKTRQQLQNISTIIILVMSAIGGSMVPIFIMPTIMQKIAVISLNYWGIQGYYDIFWRGLSFSEIIPKMVILLVIGLVMTSISIPLFKKNINSFTN